MGQFKNSLLPVLLYDEECVFCNRFKQALERLPRSEEIRFVSIHDKDIYKEFPDLDIKECHETVHLIDENNKIYQGPEVVKYLAKFYPHVSKLSWMLETQAGTKALKVFYDGVNTMRKKALKNCSSCNKGSH